MNKTIEVKTDKHYGTVYVYVVSEHQQAIQALTGNKTIQQKDVNALRKLGFEFKEVASSIL
jgi:hypothetical protein